MVRRGGWIVLVLCALSWMGCGAKVKLPESVEPAHRTPEDVQSQMETLFPEDGAFPGWQKRSVVAFFDEETLFQHINGAAEAFFAYDFQLCGTVEYNPVENSSEDNFILVDIYHMGRAINAFGMYASEFYPESEFVDIGAQGYVESPALNFWKGPYYVKITGSSPVEEITRANMELAEYISQKIPGKAEKPSMLSLLPGEGLVSGTERFILSNILGYSFLKNGVTATYRVGDEEKSLIVMECESVDDAKDRLAQFAAYEEKSGEGMTWITDLGEEGFAVNDKYYKRLIVVRQGRHLAVVMGFTDEAAARGLIEMVIENISSVYVINTAFSSWISLSFQCSPPENPPRLPSDRTTR